MTDPGAAAFFVTKNHPSRAPRPTARAGWYRDPQRAAPYRFWSGSEWTEHTGSDVTADPPADSDSDQAR